MVNPTTFVFVRHGHYPKTAPRGPVRDATGLSALGCLQAQAAAGWVRSQNLGVQLVVHTSTARATETARIVQRHLSAAIPVLKQRAGFRRMADLDGKIAQWASQHPAGVVLFCGHDSSQRAITRLFGLDVSRDARSVLVLSRDGSGWRFVSGAVNPRPNEIDGLTPLPVPGT